MKEFKELLKKEVEKRGYQLDIRKIAKPLPDESYEGVSICNDKRCEAICVPIENLYRDYQQMNSIEKVVDKLVVFTEDIQSKLDTYSFEFEDLKDKIKIRLLNLVDSMEYLKGIPHIEFLDLGVYPYIDFSDGTAALGCEVLKGWDKTLEEVLEIGKQNTHIELCSYLPQLWLFKSEGLYCNPEILQDLAEKQEGDLIIVPMHLDVVFIHIENKPYTLKEIRDLYLEVLEREGDEEVLSRVLYRYSRERQQLELII